MEAIIGGKARNDKIGALHKCLVQATGTSTGCSKRSQKTRSTNDGLTGENNKGHQTMACMPGTVPLALSLALTGGDAPPGAAETLTLEQAVGLALENNQDIKNAALEVSKTEDRIAAAKTQRFPSIDLNVVESRLIRPLEFKFEKDSFGTFPGIGSVPAKDTTLERSTSTNVLASAGLTQPMLQLYKIGLGVKARQVGREIDEQAQRSERQRVVNQVRQVYYGILEYESALEAREESLRYDRELNVQIDRYVAEETALASDSLRVKAQLAKDE